MLKSVLNIILIESGGGLFGEDRNVPVSHLSDGGYYFESGKPQDSASFQRFDDGCLT